MGKASFDRNILAVDLEMGSGNYSVELEQCTDSAGMLDSILMVAGHRDCTPEILFDFIKCLNNVCIGNARGIRTGTVLPMRFRKEGAMEAFA